MLAGCEHHVGAEKPAGMSIDHHGVFGNDELEARNAHVERVTHLGGQIDPFDQAADEPQVHEFAELSVGHAGLERHLGGERQCRRQRKVGAERTGELHLFDIHAPSMSGTTDI